MNLLIKLGILALATIPCVKGTGALLVPQPSFIKEDEVYASDAIIVEQLDDAKQWKNASVFYYRFRDLKFPDLRTYLEKKNFPDCRNTPIDGPPVETSNLGNNLQWGKLNGDEEVFMEIDHGPCEIWMDNIRIFDHWDCADREHFPLNFDIDYSKCHKERCIIRFYWLHMDIFQYLWRVQGQCVPITYNPAPGTVNPAPETHLDDMDTAMEKSQPIGTPSPPPTIPTGFESLRETITATSAEKTTQTETTLQPHGISLNGEVSAALA